LNDLDTTTPKKFEGLLKRQSYYNIIKGLRKMRNRRLCLNGLNPNAREVFENREKFCEADCEIYNYEKQIYDDLELPD